MYRHILIYNTYSKENLEFIISNLNLKKRKTKISLVSNKKRAFEKLKHCYDIDLVLICGEIIQEGSKVNNNRELYFLKDLIRSEFKDIHRFYVCKGSEFAFQEGLRKKYATIAAYPENLRQIHRLLLGE